MSTVGGMCFNVAPRTYTKKTRVLEGLDYVPKIRKPFLGSITKKLRGLI